VTINANAIIYCVDRFAGVGQTTDGVFTLQQSTTAPTGFVNSLVATVTTADASIGTTQRYILTQRIEGTNVADLGWGTASAKTVTLSFWVRSSLTGTFSGSLRNSAGDRSYPYTYTISVADTWEYKTVTIPGDTSGTWLTTTGVGIGLTFSLGAGTDVSGTANNWSGSSLFSATGATNVISTLNATWYITGVQLEVGSTATEFEYRPYGTEWNLCQRYYEKMICTDTLPICGQAYSSTQMQAPITWKVTKRASPTIAFSGTGNLYNATGSGFSATYTYSAISTDVAFLNGTTSSVLTAGNAVLLYTTGTSFFSFSAEL
jgi:hypothetical protein